MSVLRERKRGEPAFRELGHPQVVFSRFKEVSLWKRAADSARAGARAVEKPVEQAKPRAAGLLDWVFYRPKCIGKNGETFTLWKIRTMEFGADRKIKELMSVNGFDEHFKPIGLKQFTTRFTRFLRKFHFDEIPQFLDTKPINPFGHLNPVGIRPFMITLDEIKRVPPDVQENYLKIGPGLVPFFYCLKKRPVTIEEYHAEMRSYYLQRNAHMVRTDLKYLFNAIVYSVLRGRLGE
jgi:lipopolysaccharide/colanic/teichoic acid biosynthesis glycosyltransferase